MLKKLAACLVVVCVTPLSLLVIIPAAKYGLDWVIGLLVLGTFASFAALGWSAVRSGGRGGIEPEGRD